LGNLVIFYSDVKKDIVRVLQNKVAMMITIVKMIIMIQVVFR